eukprot:1835305-Alexandrium_andersonii.AAC.1
MCIRDRPSGNPWPRGVGGAEASEAGAGCAAASASAVRAASASVCLMPAAVDHASQVSRWPVP